MSTFMRMVQQGETALEAWRLHYPQLNALFTEVQGFEAFLLVISNNLLRDNNFGMMIRVSAGAALSTIDASTDLYVVATYFSEGLSGKAQAMLLMIVGNLFVQLVIVFGQYKKHSWKDKTREVLYTLFFMRPAVDAFRISTNHVDGDSAFDSLNEM